MVWYVRRALPRCEAPHASALHRRARLLLGVHVWRVRARDADRCGYARARSVQLSRDKSAACGRLIRMLPLHLIYDTDPRGHDYQVAQYLFVRGFRRTRKSDRTLTLWGYRKPRRAEHAAYTTMRTFEAFKQVMSCNTPTCAADGASPELFALRRQLLELQENTHRILTSEHR